VSATEDWQKICTRSSTLQKQAQVSVSTAANIKEKHGQRRPPLPSAGSPGRRQHGVAAAIPPVPTGGLDSPVTVEPLWVTPDPDNRNSGRFHCIF